jgi:hypothetical protein
VSLTAVSENVFVFNYYDATLKPMHLAMHYKGISKQSASKNQTVDAIAMSLPASITDFE